MAKMPEREARGGFAERIRVSAEPFSAWKERAARRPDPRWRAISSDPCAFLPDARSMELLLWPYAPFVTDEKLPAISAYYIASNASHEAARSMGFLCDDVPLKAALARSGRGRYGRNGLTAVKGYGSRFAIQCLLSKEEADMPPAEDPDAFSPECKNCFRCVRACPTGALRGDGTVDMAKCLRAQNETAPLPEAYRPLIGNSLLGCDICQDVCPRNRSVPRVLPEEELRMAIDLGQLLSGNVAPLVPLIGKNYARVRRMQARACLVAANTGRRDLLPLIEPLGSSDYAALSRHAAWAANILT